MIFFFVDGVTHFFFVIYLCFLCFLFSNLRDEDKTICDYAIENNETKVKECLDKGISINFQDEDGQR